MDGSTTRTTTAVLSSTLTSTSTTAGGGTTITSRRSLFQEGIKEIKEQRRLEQQRQQQQLQLQLQRRRLQQQEQDNDDDDARSSSNKDKNNDNDDNDNDNDNDNDDNDECTLYLAPSSIMGAGYGIYTTKSFSSSSTENNNNNNNNNNKKDTSTRRTILNPDGPCISVVSDEDEFIEPAPESRTYLERFDNVWWGINGGMSDHMRYDYSGTVYDYQIMFGALPNYHPYLWNIESEQTDIVYDDTMANRYLDPTAGSFTYYTGKHFYARQRPGGGGGGGGGGHIRAGDELFLDYGEKWFHRDEDLFGNIPRRTDYIVVARILAQFPSIFLSDDDDDDDDKEEEIQDESESERQRQRKQQQQQHQYQYHRDEDIELVLQIIQHTIDGMGPRLEHRERILALLPKTAYDVHNINDELYILRSQYDKKQQQKQQQHKSSVGDNSIEGSRYAEEEDDDFDFLIQDDEGDVTEEEAVLEDYQEEDNDDDDHDMKSIQQQQRQQRQRRYILWLAEAIARRISIIPRSIDWIKEEGVCLDNLVPRISTINSNSQQDVEEVQEDKEKEDDENDDSTSSGIGSSSETRTAPTTTTAANIGMGAITQRKIKKNDIIVPVPLLHIPDINDLAYRGVDATTSTIDDEDNYIKVDNNNNDNNDNNNNDNKQEEDEDDDDDDDSTSNNNNKMQQLLMNYCFGHKNSTLALCPTTNAILINHCSNRTIPTSIPTSSSLLLNKYRCKEGRPNAALRWATSWDTDTKQNLQLSFEEISKTNIERLVSLDVIALRDINKGEEIFIDYGAEWENAWYKYVINWKSPSLLLQQQQQHNHEDEGDDEDMEVIMDEDTIITENRRRRRRRLQLLSSSAVHMNQKENIDAFGNLRDVMPMPIPGTDLFTVCWYYMDDDRDGTLAEQQEEEDEEEEEQEEDMENEKENGKEKEAVDDKGQEEKQIPETDFQGKEEEEDNIIEDENEEEEEEKQELWTTLSDDEIIQRYSIDGSQYIMYSQREANEFWPCSVIGKTSTTTTSETFENNNNNEDDDNDVQQEHEEDDTYTVRIYPSPYHDSPPSWFLDDGRELDEQPPFLLTNYNRSSIRYITIPMSSDQHLQTSFRHIIGIPDDMFPQQWMNKKKDH